MACARIEVFTGCGHGCVSIVQAHGNRRGDRLVARKRLRPVDTGERRSPIQCGPRSVSIGVPARLWLPYTKRSIQRCLNVVIIDGLG